ncbi:unnamed protein product [Cuscuta campestris]|uniref:Uncharacterized protein n=2 Tax=Cuscuta sect. Cleistogrammica TaxID=1824901 RepID=A0A484K8D7_9ASTE|nr:hypothetical protein DM860_011853 [Cuscuta australis]VFQ59587.1 unnamed protein product [Cuscuta campestris]
MKEEEERAVPPPAPDGAVSFEIASPPDIEGADGAASFEIAPPPAPTKIEFANDDVCEEVAAPTETEGANDAVCSDAAAAAPPTPTGGGSFKKKNRSKSFSLLKAALNIFSPENEKSRPSSAKKKKTKSGGDWKTVVGSMRPLTLQDRSPTPSLPSMSPSCSYENLATLTGSPSPSHVSSCGSSTMSRYASATNLQDLDAAGSDPDEVFDAIEGDEMIDVKAEEFIARFYQQMKLQQRQHHHHHRHQRL